MKATLLALGLLASLSAFATEVKVGDSAPSFTTKTHEGKDFSLDSRKGKWTVLYFYPKAETPGCTTQACAFRDNLKKITAQDAEVYGISTDTVADQAKFHQNHKLNFTLLADADATITEKFGAKMPVMKMSKRWTYIIGPDLKIKSIDQDVDPAMDATKVAAKIGELKKK